MTLTERYVGQTITRCCRVCDEEYQHTVNEKTADDDLKFRIDNFCSNRCMMDKYF